MIDVAIRSATKPGEGPCGDVAIALDHVVAVIDGLGHGAHAADAARLAADVIRANPTLPIDELFGRCNTQLHGSRGAVMAIARFDPNADALTWAGIGNVEGVVARATPGLPDTSLPSRGGIVGFRMPSVLTRTVPMRRGDLLVLASDGVTPAFRSVVYGDAVGDIADAVLARGSRGDDDACVLVARYLGLPALDVVAIQAEADLVVARTRARAIAREAGLSEVNVEALALAVSEIARNIVDHASSGELEVHAIDRGVEVIARDLGPGIANVHAIADGVSTGRGLGLGLSSARRLVDELEIDSRAGAGTTVRLRKWR